MKKRDKRKMKRRAAAEAVNAGAGAPAAVAAPAATDKQERAGLNVHAVPTGLRRGFRNIGYGDHAASRTKKSLAGFTSRSYSPYRDILPFLRELRSRSRQLYIGAPIACAALRALRTNVIGRGLRLHVKPDADALGMSAADAAAWARRVESAFQLWAGSRSCDFMGMHTFRELQQVAFLSMLQSGDAFCLFRAGKPTAWHPDELRLQLLEADRVCTENGTTCVQVPCGVELENGNRVFDGVEISKSGGVAAYWIADKHPADGMALTWKRVPARGAKTGAPNILHLMHAERPEQLRGVPFIAVALEPVLQLGRYLNAEEVAALMETYMTGYITTEQADTPIMGNMGLADDENGEDAERDIAALEPEPGAVHQLLPGEKITFNDPKRPGSQFDPFVTAVCKQIGAALEIPVDVLLKSYNSSYSASRAAMMDFWKTVTMYREWFVNDFCMPVYTEWLTQAVASGRIKADGFFADAMQRHAWLGQEWTGSACLQLDPVKEVKAMQMQVEMGWMTNEQATHQLTGGDFTDNIMQLQQENRQHGRATTE